MWHLELPEMKAEVVVVARLTFASSLKSATAPKRFYRTPKGSIEPPCGLSLGFHRTLVRGISELQTGFYRTVRIELPLFRVPFKTLHPPTALSTTSMTKQGLHLRNILSTAWNSMTSSERPSPEPLLQKEAFPAVRRGREFWKCTGGLTCLELQSLRGSSRTLEGNSRKSSESVAGIFLEFLPESLSRTAGMAQNSLDLQRGAEDCSGEYGF